MNDGDVLFPWEKEGGDRDADAPDADVDPVDPDTTAGEAGTRGPVAPDASGADADAPEAVAGEPAAEEADAAAAVEPDGRAPAEVDATVAATASEVGGTTGGADVGAAVPGSAAANEADAGEDDPTRFALLDTEYARKAAERASAALREKPIAQKEYYAISEVCELVGLKPHVLRYWETQFQVLNPSKNRSGNRVYQRKEIRLIMLVKHLLYEEKYTVEGAKAKLDRLRRDGELAETAGVVLDRSMIEQLRADLSELTTLLTPPARS